MNYTVKLVICIGGHKLADVLIRKWTEIGLGGHSIVWTLGWVGTEHPGSPSHYLVLVGNLTLGTPPLKSGGGTLV